MLIFTLGKTKLKAHLQNHLDIGINWRSCRHMLSGIFTQLKTFAFLRIRLCSPITYWKCANWLIKIWRSVVSSVVIRVSYIHTFQCLEEAFGGWSTLLHLDDGIDESKGNLLFVFVLESLPKQGWTLVE